MIKRGPRGTAKPASFWTEEALEVPEANAHHRLGALGGLERLDSRRAREREDRDGLLRKMDLCEQGWVDPQRMRLRAETRTETQGQA